MTKHQQYQRAKMIISKAEEMNPTRRDTMEDCILTHSPGSWGCNDSQMSFLAVIDGHGGRDIVDFLQDSLEENIARELNYHDEHLIDCCTDDNTPIHQTKKTKINNVSDSSDDVVDINTAAGMSIRIERAFLMTDIESHLAGIKTSGATVALCLVKKSNDSSKIVIHSANVGDARAVLSCQPTKILNTTSSEANTCPSHDASCYRLTQDHKADNPEEVERIQKAGGFVTKNQGGCSRVLGVLNVSRSLGDHVMKEFIIARPYVSTVEIDLGNSSKYVSSREFIILACDGLWDVIGDKEAVKLVRDYIADNMNTNQEEKKSSNLTQQPSTSLSRKECRDEEELLSNAAQMLCDYAIKNGSTDNISIVVAWL